MDNWSLPTSLNIGGVEHEIRTDYRQIIKLLKYLGEPDYEGLTGELILNGMYKNPREIPPSMVAEAIEKAVQFIDMGQEQKPHDTRPRLMDWEQDANLIIPAVNRVAREEIRLMPYMHWWTFMGYYMEIGECSFSTVVNIRAKIAKGEKLEEWEQKYYRANKDVVQLKTKMTSEQRNKEEADAAALRALLGD